MGRGAHFTSNIERPALSEGFVAMPPLKPTLKNLWGLLLLFVGIWFFLIPFGITTHYILNDEGLHQPGGSEFAFAWHKKLSGRYENYALRRVESGDAAQVDTYDIAGTEWPLFGSVFFLWSTMQLQESWEADNSLSKTAPKEYARSAIDAAVALVLDENHATWVKTHWGEVEYLERENVFYRMLMMWAVIAEHELTDSEEHLEILRAQAQSLSAELAASPSGLLDDYPGQCYPTDVVAALAAIHRADEVLGTDRNEFLQRSLRGFTGALAQPLGLPPYAADSGVGLPLDGSRGCGNSYLCSFGPEVWQPEGAQWYRHYVDNFWQENWFAVGFREFPTGQGGEEWYFDVDAGPVLGGFGSAASAFGVAAARTNGDFKRAYSMSTEMLAMSWPLANGTLLLPRLVSDGDHAPHLGEMAILFQLSREPVLSGPMASSGKGKIAGCVWVVLGLQFLLGGMFTWRGLRRQFRRGS
ncbi:MAG: hypothetical protein ACI8XO_000843 [Verrucomicrobiales bacterium]|jgi:hypothetical protein